MVCSFSPVNNNVCICVYVCTHMQEHTYMCDENSDFVCDKTKTWCGFEMHFPNF